ncbi:MAG: hypothetical protein DRI87_09225 [Bacteroidetes bacterium]|nr:MAG: hypothetical protein DRI87_09225 [Bacteroidota bacterium]
MLITETGYHHLKPEKYYLDTIGGIGIKTVLSPEEKQQAEQDYADNLANYNNVKALYDNLKDGGDTDGTVSDVETAWPDEMWELRAELLAKSPHLSYEVLKSVADKTDVFPDEVIFEIMAANPDELRKNELITYLETKENPLPEYMISILHQLAGGITYKTVLMQEMARYHAAKMQSAYDLIRSTLNDSLVDYTYLRNWLDNTNTLNADMQTVASYMEEGDYTSAQSLLNLVPDAYGLEGDELDAYNEYKSLAEIQMNWQQQGRTVFDLDSAEIAMLVDYAENGLGKAAVISKGILEFAYGYHYCNCLPVNDSSNMKSSNAFAGTNETDNGLLIEATPNPARTWVAFNYKLPVFATEAVLRITDVSGKTITTFTLNSKQGQQVWDIRNIEKGVYLYTLKAESLSKSGKLIIN